MHEIWKCSCWSNGNHMSHGCVRTPFIRHLLTSTVLAFAIEEHLRMYERWNCTWLSNGNQSTWRCLHFRMKLNCPCWSNANHVAYGCAHVCVMGSALEVVEKAEDYSSVEHSRDAVFQKWVLWRRKNIFQLLNVVQLANHRDPSRREAIRA